MIRVGKMSMADVFEKTEFLECFAGFVKWVKVRYTLTVSEFLDLSAGTLTVEYAVPRRAY